MKHAHYILGLTTFCVAGTVAAFIISQPPASPPDRTASGARAAAGLQGQKTRAASSPSSKSEPVRMAVLLGAVDAPGDDPLLMERAALVEAAAHERLAALTEQLHLNRKQQALAFPLLARSSPHYDEGLRITGRSGLGLVTPISRRDAEREIYDLLDAGQQADLDLAEAEKDVWWSAVISRLERDLHKSTQGGEAPESSSEPPAASPPEADPPPPAGGPPPRRGRSPF